MDALNLHSSFSSKIDLGISMTSCYFSSDVKFTSKLILKLTLEVVSKYIYFLLTSSVLIVF